jgi:hypothetical protein
MSVKHKFEHDVEGWWFWRVVNFDKDGMPDRTWISQTKFPDEKDAKEDLEYFCKVTSNGPGPLIDE